jgi:hypothetical protein
MNRSKDKIIGIISIDAEKHIEKIHHIFMKKALKKVGIGGI